jgi:hypothetical protein
MQPARFKPCMHAAPDAACGALKMSELPDLQKSSHVSDEGVSYNKSSKLQAEMSELPDHLCL